MYFDMVLPLSQQIWPGTNSMDPNATGSGKELFKAQTSSLDVTHVTVNTKSQKQQVEQNNVASGTEHIQLFTEQNCSVGEASVKKVYIKKYPLY